MVETYETGDFTLQRVDENVWEIPKNGDMRVPARVLASRQLLDEISQDATLRQISNTTHLPGITSHAICMPDGHQGYGFPVGGVGATDATDGCISPGAVGYDINCLVAGTEVLLPYGRRRPIETLAEDVADERAIVAGKELTEADIRLFTETNRDAVYELETIDGDTITATAEHPVLTPRGMVKLDDLSNGDTVYLHPYRGFPDEAPPAKTILDQSDFDTSDSDFIDSLSERDLLPLATNDEALSLLLKLVGYHIAAGTFDEASGQTEFYGESETLKTVKADIERLGFDAILRTDNTCSETDIDENDGERCSLTVTSNGFLKVCKALSVRSESKPVESPLPPYFELLAKWQQGLFLGAFFGAALSSPASASNGRLVGPTVSVKTINRKKSASTDFLYAIRDVLDAIGIASTLECPDETPTYAVQKSTPDRLQIQNDPENLHRFFSQIGYRYNQHKRRCGLLAIKYLQRYWAISPNTAATDDQTNLISDGGSVRPSSSTHWSDNGNSTRHGHGTVPRQRPPDRSTEPSGFREFCEANEVRQNMTVATTVRSITETGTATVYDIGVDHEAHNFIANGFVVGNCGVRMMTTNLHYEELQGKEEELVNALFANVPSGLGGGGVVETDRETLEEILDRGVEWAVENDYGIKEDLLSCEDEGRRPDAEPAKVSKKAKDRGKNQLGSLGSGNHFLEVQRVTDRYRPTVADTFGLEKDQIVVLIHCGSRGLGHQTCNDYLRDIEQRHQGLLARLPDKELAAAPAGSQLAEEYYAAMCACINFAWVNRQLIMHRTRRVFEKVFDREWQTMDMHLLYDVAHNIAKREVHTVGLDNDGQPVPHDRSVDETDRELFVHRKGATRAFPAGHTEIPSRYESVGQPILIPGSMGAGSYVLRGGDRSMRTTFGSTAHGAGRLMSRTEAKNTYWGGDVQDDLRMEQQIYVKANSGATVAEEAPGVYKDVDEVVRVSDALGIGDRVARTFPVCNIKG